MTELATGALFLPEWIVRVFVLPVGDAIAILNVLRVIVQEVFVLALQAQDPALLRHRLDRALQAVLREAGYV